jgi:hypothetical protein
LAALLPRRLIVPKDRNPMVAMPKLYVVAVHKLLGALFCFLVVSAPKFVTVQHVSVGTDNKGAIVLHGLLRWL